MNEANRFFFQQPRPNIEQRKRQRHKQILVRERGTNRRWRNTVRKEERKQQRVKLENKTAESYKLNGKLSIFKWHVTLRIEAVDSTQTPNDCKHPTCYKRIVLHFGPNTTEINENPAWMVVQSKRERPIIHSIHVL